MSLIFPERLLIRRYAIQADLWGLHREQEQLSSAIRPLEKEQQEIAQSGGPRHGSKGRRLQWVRERLGPLHERGAELRKIEAARRADLLKVEAQLRETFQALGHSLTLSSAEGIGADRKADEAAQILKDPFLHDVFISHAVEDKCEVAWPLVENLRELAIRVWYDATELSIGDSLQQSIDHGLLSSRFGVVIISPAFLEKAWTAYEFESLVALEIAEGKVILPIWHRVSKDEVICYSPRLADKVALHTATSTISDIALEIAILVHESRRLPLRPTQPAKNGS